MTIKLSAAPGDVQSRLQALLPQAIIPALDQALLKTELWLSELSAERLRKGEPDVHAKDSQALHAASEQIRRKCQEKLKAAIDALPRFEPAGKKKSVLSLIDDDQMEMQLAGERLVEKLSYLHRKGLEAADQRLTKVMGLGPFGLSLPFSPYTLSDAVRFGLADLDVADEYKALVMRHFEALVARALAINPQAATAVLEKDRQRFSHAPVIVTVIACLTPGHKVPEQEQLLSGGAVCFALLQAAQAMGFGAQWLTGWAAYDPVIHGQLGLAGNERVLGFIHIGTCHEMVPERERPDAKTLTRELRL